MTDPAPGFRDLESKARVRRAAIRVGVAGLVLQFVVPLALMFTTVSGAGLGEVRTLDPERGVFWKGSLWLIETGTGLLDGKSRTASLMRWAGARADPLETMARFDVFDPWLLAATDRLWIVAYDAVGWLGGNGIEIERVAPASPAVSSPFLWRGRPALVGETPSGLALFSFVDGAWALAAPLDLGTLSAEVGAPDVCLEEDGNGGEPWLFVRTAEALLVGRGLPAGGAVDTRASLEPAVEGPEASGQWDIVMVGGAPLLVTVLTGGGRPEVAGYRRADGSWERHLSIDLGLPGTVGAYADERRPGRVLVACQAYPGSVTVWDVRDGEVGATFKLGKNPFEGTWSSGWQVANYALTLLVPILAVLLLAPVLARHRTRDHRLQGPDGPAVEFASLPRRALAKGLDGVIALLPVGLTAHPLLGSYLDVERTIGESLGSLGTWLGIAFGWSALCWLLFSVLEARFGRTPGKRLAGIRVVTLSGGRVSVGRALLRNLLLMADGALGGLVGIILVALTPRWQRLGDLAAKTLVIRG